MTHAVGVDFGTTTTLLAEGRAGRLPTVFPAGLRGTSYVPSLVGVAADGSIRVAEAASDLPPDRVRRSIKRAITHGETELSLADFTVSVEEGIRALLTELAVRARGDVELQPGAVRLGCPAMWTGPQRKRLLDIARTSGLPVDDHTLVDEPVAAGVAWVNHRMTATRSAVKGQLLVFDMGGGTLDVAVLDVHAELGQVPEITVLSSWGVDEAGDALDDALARDLEGQLEEQGVVLGSLPNPDGVRSALRQAAIEAKERLSTALDTTVAVRFPGLDLPVLTLSREQLEVAFAPQLERARALVLIVMKGAQVTHEIAKSPAEIRAMQQSSLAQEVDYVLLAGGMGRVPAVAQLMGDIFPAAEISADAGVPSDEAIVAGLAETMSYERINLHRPPFHFVLEYQGEDGAVAHQSVYEAYSPFYAPHLALQRSVLYFEWRPGRNDLPRRGLGYLRVFTAGGEPVRIAIEGEEDHGLKVRFGNSPPAVLIYPNGRVLIIDGKGERTAFMVPRWPVIRGKDHAVLYVKKAADTRTPDLGSPWMKDPLFLH
ncbi:Hsp70 family protein [Marmoricola sp. URHB0036]|uniref:Hsp70 family protein n=1 Tax=Marmoricola sp. URHB0036 TaxID=1298863 RepID=UPI000482A054|nr:Hsp70 family protein [Marmoricola sp. URHB0036]